MSVASPDSEHRPTQPSSEEPDFLSPEVAIEVIAGALMSPDSLSVLKDLKTRADNFQIEALGTKTTGAVREQKAFIALCDSLLARVVRLKSTTEESFKNLVEEAYRSHYKNHSWHTSSVFALLARELYLLCREAYAPALENGEYTTFLVALALSPENMEMENLLNLAKLSDDELRQLLAREFEANWNDWLEDVDLDTDTLPLDQVVYRLWWKAELRHILRSDIVVNQSKQPKTSPKKEKNKRKK